MAENSINDIKARMKSVKGTMQITKAMELVATSKLRRAKEKLENSRPFYESLYSTLSSFAATLGDGDSVFTETRESKRTLYVLLAGDRGLAGAYNSTVFKLSELLAERDGGEAVFLPVGKKALEYCRHKGKTIYPSSVEYISDVGVGDCFGISAELARSYAEGEFDRIRLVYTRFVSMLSSSAVYEDVLPFVKDENAKAIGEPLLETDIEELLPKIIPDYIGGILWSAVCEACASEHGARRSSMNSANKNADEMISGLMLKYNRARQAIITQEITEIVSGAEAL